MARRGIDRLCVARGRTVAAAVVRGAQVRAALQHPSRHPDVGLTGIVALLFTPTIWVLGNATGFWRVGLVLWRVPVAGPFPDIADHVVQAIAIGRESCHRRGARKTILAAVLMREVALPDVGHVLATRRQLVAPGELRAIQARARGKFPFRLGWQVLAGPARISERIGIGAVHNRMMI